MPLAPYTLGFCNPEDRAEDREESDYSDDERSEHSVTNRQILAGENLQIFVRQYNNPQKRGKRQRIAFGSTNSATWQLPGEQQ